MTYLKRLFCNPNNQRPSLVLVVVRLMVFVLFFLSIRWFVIEPFVVPSGSMFPNLFVNDYITVTRPSMGVKVPFTQKWLVGPKLPKRGEILVFKSKNNGPYFVKRLVGLPGDRITLQGHRLLKVNDIDVTSQPQPEQWEQYKERFDPDGAKGFQLFSENIEGKKYLTMYRPLNADSETIFEFFVPQAELFFMGDHRDHSSDSRDWGTVPISHLVGPVWKILLSCEQRNVSFDFCDLSTIRWDRAFKTP